MLHPGYIEHRMNELFHNGPQLDLTNTSIYSLPSLSSTILSTSPQSCPYHSRYLLCHVDTNDDMDSGAAMQRLNIIGIQENITLLLAWRFSLHNKSLFLFSHSKEQMASHVETLCHLQKQLTNSSTNSLMGVGVDAHFDKVCFD
jgi:hypothetical protein